MFTGNAHSPPLETMSASMAFASSRELPPAETWDAPNSRASRAIFPARTYFFRTSSLTEGVLDLLLGDDALPDELRSPVGYVHDGRRLRVLGLAAVDARVYVPLQVLEGHDGIHGVLVRVQVRARG